MFAKTSLHIFVQGQELLLVGFPAIKKLVRANISKTFGTRHRAGIGLTEETDAVVIIVSEETGSIMTAVGNSIEKNIDIGSLRDFLSKNLITKT